MIAKVGNKGTVENFTVILHTCAADLRNTESGGIKANRRENGDDIVEETLRAVMKHRKCELGLQTFH